MNERIRELAVKAGLIQYDSDGKINDVEKFVDLLISECADTVQNFVDHRFPASEYPVRLKKYFGIET